MPRISMDFFKERTEDNVVIEVTADIEDVIMSAWKQRFLLPVLTGKREVVDAVNEEGKVYYNSIKYTLTVSEVEEVSEIFDHFKSYTLNRIIESQPLNKS